MFYTNKQSISSHFRLSANHADKQVMLHLLSKENHPFCSQYSLISDVMLIMWRQPKFVRIWMDRNKINRTAIFHSITSNSGENNCAELQQQSFWKVPSLSAVPLLTLSSPAVSNGLTSKRSGPYWPNPPFLIFNFLTFGHSGTQDWAPVCPSVKILKRRVRPAWPWTLW